MVPGKAAKPWTLQGHRVELDEHWLSGQEGAAGKRQGRGDILVCPAKGVAGREGAAEAPLACPVPPRPWLSPCLGMELVLCPVSLTPRHIPSKLTKGPEKPFPCWCWREREGMGHPRDTARPTVTALQ